MNIGAAYENMGLNQLSMEYHENAIQVLRKQRGTAKVTEAEIYNQIGSCTQNMQLYAKAHDAYRHALDILKKYPSYKPELYWTADDYPVYICMGKIIEHIHLRRAALPYYIKAYQLLNKKKEIVSETAEIYLILATYARNWEKRPDSVKNC